MVRGSRKRLTSESAMRGLTDKKVIGKVRFLYDLLQKHVVLTTQIRSRSWLVLQVISTKQTTQNSDLMLENTCKGEFLEQTVSMLLWTVPVALITTFCSECHTCGQSSCWKFVLRTCLAWQQALQKMERVMGIEPTLFAWEAKVLPLNYTRLVSGWLAWSHWCGRIHPV